MISFLLNNETVHIDDTDHHLTVLEWLREERKLTGTKEGCGSGDCGACTVVLAEVVDQKLSYKPINSCITFMPALSGKQLITVEHLNAEAMHPVQEAMVECHGSQCGFCTPGFVMSMFSLYQQRHNNSTNLSRHEINESLSGNLCRCTGYRPIVDACMQACSQPKPDQFNTKADETVECLTNLPNSQGVEHFYIPKSTKELSDIVNNHTNITFVAGSTDLGLDVTQQHKRFDTLVSLSNVAELNVLDVADNQLIIGAAVTYQQMSKRLLEHFPEAEEWLERLGSLPIRSQGTMGGNVANASPIGDCPPLLFALNASCVIDNGTQQRTIPIREFFVGYRQTVLSDNEWLKHISIPLKPADSLFRIYKISKRMEDDISAVCASFYVELEDNHIRVIRTGFGGVAATPVAATEFEQQLVGKVWDENTFALGETLLFDAFNPIDDVRSSANYRREMVKNLWRRFVLETAHQPTELSVRVQHA